MKKIRVVITHDMEIPDNWEIVEHADQITVFKIDEKYYDFDLKCFSTNSNEKKADWTEDDRGTDMITDHILASNTKITER